MKEISMKKTISKYIKTKENFNNLFNIYSTL